MGAPSRHKIHTENYQEQAENYKRYLDILGLKNETTQSRYLYLKEFLSFLEKQKIFETTKVTPKEIADYHCYLQNKTSRRTGKPITEKTVYDNMRNLQQYLGYLLELGTLKKSPASHLKFTLPKEKAERFIFTQEQIRELYEVADLEEIAILNTGYGCGLRVQEISDLNKEDIRLSENLIIVQRGKNSKRRLIPISEKISEELREFLFSTEKNKANALFINNKERRMQEWTFNKALKTLVLKTEFGKLSTSEELNRIGMHSLRHSIATHLLENGMKLEQVQKFLGHSHIESTEIYTHISQMQINNLYDDAS